jgi:RNA:NAD 2'-phosphotransferase (TPT1/KptA family)
MAMNRHNLSKTVQHSKALSYILRHGAVEKGIPITKGFQCDFILFCTHHLIKQKSILEMVLLS